MKLTIYEDDFKSKVGLIEKLNQMFDQVTKHIEKLEDEFSAMKQALTDMDSENESDFFESL